MVEVTCRFAAQRRRNLSFDAGFVMQWEPIIAAAITGLLALIGVIWQSRKTRHVNSREHADSQAKLDGIATKVDRISDKVETVSDRLDDHIVMHRMTERKQWWRK